jgi:hypothetical protein
MRSSVSSQPVASASATLKMVGLTMGSGDSWPAVDLAKVQFNQSGARSRATRLWSADAPAPRA